MRNDKQTSVEWLFNQIKNHIDAEDGSMSMNWLHDGTLEQAKGMYNEEVDGVYWLGYGDHQTQNIHNLNEIFDYILGGKQ